jgi:hypothetical protein
MKYIRTAATLVVAASLAMMAVAAPAQTRKSQKPTSKVPSQKQQAPSPELGQMVGTWTLRDGEKPLKHIRMVFRDNGTFAFVGPGWQSTGRFKVAQDHKLALEWSTVDGEKIAPGSMKKEFPMTDDESAFTIDKYTYFKLPPRS